MLKQGRYCEVVLRGEWSRTDTERGETYWYTKRLRKLARDRGWYFDSVCPTKNQSPKIVGGLSGTFVFAVNVDHTSNALKVAEHVLRAMLYSELCRPPKIRIDRDASTWTWKRIGSPDFVEVAP